MKPLLRNTPAWSRGKSSTTMQPALLRPTRPMSMMRTVRPSLEPSSSSLSSSSRSTTIARSTALRTSSTPLSAFLARSYSTAPNQHQVLQSFGTPFAQFIYTISRIARIITFSALGVATIGVVSFEAAHQYVEHIAMPAASASASSSSSPDEYGWSEQALEESWSGSPDKTGTDPRLGIKGRHAVRSAWMCANWGGGISPGVMFGGAAGNAGLGRTAITSMGSAKTLKVDDGMILAMQYLNLAVKIAAAKGFKLPDTDAIRAGLIGEEAARQQLSNVDPLALALEARLAAVKERQGSRGALESAIASYEKLYDVASLTTGGKGEQASRLVRLATKLGDLHSALERREDAEEWLNKAVSIAATAGASTPELDQKLVVKQVKETAPEEQGKSRLGGWFSRSKPSAKDTTLTSAAKSSAVASPVTPHSGAEPTPALTRSLITALVSKSALHAHTPTTASLQQALQTQMSALQLSSAELNRLVSTTSSTSSPQSQLHTLWLTHHQSILDLHVAETIYALTRGSSSSAAAKSLIPAWFKSSAAKGEGEKSIEWLNQAEGRAERVIAALEKSGAGTGTGRKKGGAGESVVLGERWMREKEVEVAAMRILRDAKRVQATAKRSRSTLEAL
ncbi:hypothetical protein EX895_005833 [Sporisorium graminicola]|uniref:Uncharacterized protein n=1 Tax=Sporisorium graminicola TaxID=280036 RepID=A0A4U7KLD3_9BASI|nr:hypothetical protein EX895_005833 [Sporisorium graminicola]TKY84753.1 hypothetical protein EX895_005833 [Sporisorium graminicola]